MFLKKILFLATIIGNLSAMEEKSIFEISEIAQNIGTHLPITGIVALQLTCQKLNKDLAFNDDQFLAVLAANPVCETDPKLIPAFFAQKNSVVKAILLRTKKINPKVFNCHNQWGLTTLMIACADSKSTDMLNLLLTHGADISFTNLSGNNVLHYLFQHSCPAHMVEAKLKKILENQDKEKVKKVVNKQGFYHNTPLHLLLIRFAQTTHCTQEYLFDLNHVLNIINILKQYGVDPDIESNVGHTPFFILNNYYNYTREKLRSETEIAAVGIALKEAVPVQQ